MPSGISTSTRVAAGVADGSGWMGVLDGARVAVGVVGGGTVAAGSLAGGCVGRDVGSDRSGVKVAAGSSVLPQAMAKLTSSTKRTPMDIERMSLVFIIYTPSSFTLLSTV
jgi:hypothetical protein